MGLTFSPMNPIDAHAIDNWQYQEPYDVYSMNHDDPSSADELLDLRSPYYAVRDEAGELIGFMCFGTSAEVSGRAVPALFGTDGCLTVGLGMRPDLTGQGLGLRFVRAGLDFARSEFAPKSFRLFVLVWNTRAIRVYERAGFKIVRVFRQRNPSGENDFVEMFRLA
jgi:[ribosomal protein S18]-alanine N-acetyltransferase